MTDAERYLLITLAKSVQSMLSQKDDEYWNIQCGLDEVKYEDEHKELMDFADEGINPNE